MGDHGCVPSRVISIFGNQYAKPKTQTTPLGFLTAAQYSLFFFGSF